MNGTSTVGPPQDRTPRKYNSQPEITQAMSSVTIHDLSELWPESRDEPHRIVNQTNPAAEAGTFVIEPGQRVPAAGFTSHSGTEVSVVLEGDLRLVTDEAFQLGPRTIVIIPADTEHYSKNIGNTDARLAYAVFGEI